MDYWARLIVAVLAVWRITHLLAKEDGPGDLFVRVREKLGSRFVGRALDCFQCLSLWISLPFALFVTTHLFDLLLTWFALSGAACLLERIGRETVVIEPIIDEEEERDVGMLWPETRGSRQEFSDFNRSKKTISR